MTSSLSTDENDDHGTSYLKQTPKLTKVKNPTFGRSFWQQPIALIFVLAFAAIGGYLLFRSFAATSSLTKVWDTNADWNSGSLNNVSVANNSVGLATANSPTSAASADLALGRPVTASSVESSNYPASSAVDGNTSTRWSSQFSDPQWLYVDLGATYNINEVKLTWEYASGKAFQVQVSNDTNNWTTIYATSTGAGGTNDLTGLSGSGRYIRMYGTSRNTPYGYSLFEMAVYGAATTSTSANLAQGKPATASSLENSNYPASSAVDGNTSTRWSSQFSDPQWLYVDLGATYNINEVKLTWEYASGKAFKIQTSNDARNWTTIYSTRSGMGGTNDLTGLSGNGRYIRMYGTSRNTPYGYSLFEMAVYGAGTSGSSKTYTPSGSITLGFDAGASVDWNSLTPLTSLPTGTSISYQVRTSADNVNWSTWTSDITQSASSRYIQVQANLSTTNPAVTPLLNVLTLGYNTIDTAPPPTAPPPPSSPPIAAGIFVSKTGNDSTGDGSITKPFATLGRAQTAMRAGGPQITYIRGGSYTIPAVTNNGVSYGLYLTAADSGQTWSYYPPDGYDSAVLDGGPSAKGSGIQEMISIDGGSHITINGLQIQHYQWSGIQIHGGDHYYEADPVTTGAAMGNTITNNIIHDGSYDSSVDFGYGWGSFQALVNVPNTTFTNNVVYNSVTSGINFAAGAAGEGGNLSNLTITGNASFSTCQGVPDCGGLYVQDENATATNIRVSNNFVRDSGIANARARGLYLDDGTTGVIVTDNIITGIFNYALTIHGGRNDSFSSNIVDLGSSGAQSILFYQSSPITNGSIMTGNFFQSNIIISGGGGGGWQSSTPGAQPTIKNNVYHQYAGAAVSSAGSGGISGDSSPVSEDPQLSCWLYSMTSSSPAYSSPVNFVAQPQSWGPPGYSIPSTGTPPSQPHSC